VSAIALPYLAPWTHCALLPLAITCGSVLKPRTSHHAAGAKRLSRKLLQVSILTIDTQDRFNTYNDFASLDFVVQFNVRPLQTSSVDGHCACVQ
jgi:hypothetical protein